MALSGPAAMSDRGMYVTPYDPLRPVPARQLRWATPAALATAGYQPGEATFLAGGALGGGFDGGGGGGDGG